MTETAIALAPQLDGSAVLYTFADTGHDPDDVPATARRVATVVEVDGDTAPAPSGPVTIRMYRDGSFSVEGAQ